MKTTPIMRAALVPDTSYAASCAARRVRTLAPTVISDHGTGLSFAAGTDDATGLPPRGAPV